MINLPGGLFDFQESCVDYLMEKTGSSDSKDTIIIKSPTGSGKTIILIEFISRYLEFNYSKTSFVWLTPGAGELEEQSKEKMSTLAPHLNTMDLLDALNTGFSESSITFINWEMVTNKNNKSITENERKNLFDRIADAHRDGIEFILVIDEEHLNNTSKAEDIINAFSAKYKIRVSATAFKDPLSEWYEIDELEVINSGLITKAMYVNEDLEIDDNMNIDTESKYLLELANNKRKEILNEYRKINRDIRPLVLVQFPNSSDEKITRVEKELENMGITYTNKSLAKWMADDSDKINLKDITSNSNSVDFLLIKQAISTGWDCPRAKILVKLRENMDENFEIQTIGRIRRMPEAQHYDIELLDCCYLYTLDEKYTESVINSLVGTYQTKRLFLKSKGKTFQIPKESRDINYKGIGMKEIYDNLYMYYIDKYKLSEDIAKNKEILERAGFIMGDKIRGYYTSGKFVRIEELLDINKDQNILWYKADPYKHSLELLHSIERIKVAASMQTSNVRAVLKRLFSPIPRISNKILKLNKAEWFAFIINNDRRIRDDFREVASQEKYQVYRGQIEMKLNPKISNFKIPIQDKFRFDPSETNIEEYVNNIYSGYNTQMTTGKLRSTSEKLFENYCEKNKEIDWVYKNGDTGQQYFSIVYLQGFDNQRLFYPDYIVKKKNGEVWIIETKGGELNGKSKNIDIMVKNKFLAFKEYANKNNINWGFVRDKDSRLLINNTEYHDDLNNNNWKLLKDIL